MKKQGNVVRCGPADFACFDNKHLAISTTPMALSLTMDFAPCSNALRFTALCVHFVLFTMGFTRPCAKQREKKTHGSQDYVSDASKCFQQTMILYPGKHITSQRLCSPTPDPTPSVA